MDWKKRHRSFYYKHAEVPEDITLKPEETAHLIIDVQKTYLEPKNNPEENAEWQPFFNRMNDLVIPNIKNLIRFFRNKNVENMFVRIACHKESGIDRSLSQKKPGFNYLLLPKDIESGQVVDELKPESDDIVMMKTTDSALTGTNLRLILKNMDIKTVICTGIFTDQCVSSTVRSLVDESFNVIVVEDCCAAATMSLHNHELEVMNMIYCHVVNVNEVKSFLVK